MFISVIFSLIFSMGYAQVNTSSQTNDTDDSSFSIVSFEPRSVWEVLPSISIEWVEMDRISYADRLRNYRQSLSDAMRRAKTRTSIPSDISDDDFRKERSMITAYSVAQCGTSAGYSAALVPISMMVTLYAGINDVKGTVSHIHQSYQEAQAAGTAMTVDQRQFLSNVNAVNSTFSEIFQQNRLICSKVVDQVEMYREEAARRGVSEELAEYTFSGPNGDNGP